MAKIKVFLVTKFSPCIHRICVPQCSCGGQRTVLWNQFVSPMHKQFYLQSHFSNPILVKILCYYIFKFYFMCVLTCAMQHIKGGQKTTCGNQFCPSTMCSRDQMYIRLGSKPLYPLSHLTGPCPSV